MTCEKCAQGAMVQKSNLGMIAKGLVMYRIELEPGEGHDGCKGCTCQHLPVGSVEFLGSNPSRSA